MKTTSPISLPAALLIGFAVLAGACGADSTVSSSDTTFPPDPDDTGISADDDGAAADDGVADGGDLILGGGSYAVGTLKIVLAHPDADDITYELACFGDTATLIPEPTDGVRADLACTALADAEVEQYLSEGPPADQVCTEIWGGPDTATFTGMLNGKDVNIVVDRSNGCGIDTWDVLLADVLPAARPDLG